MKHRYIVVEGSIGSGKNVLSRRLATYFGARLIREDSQKNPFLLPFYLNASQHGLAMQLHFLYERSEIIRTICDEEEQGNRVISDFLLEKDQIFAPIVLDDKELDLYWKIRRKIMPEFIRPDLLIYLQCSPETAQRRLSAQEKNEQHIFPEGYLQQVTDEYGRFFHLYNEVPMLIANADELDFGHNDDHFELLLRTMSSFRGQRHYLNLSE
ncbi:MAG: deoxynucleoside kinase [Neisseria sp.]|nr:deoxynucleoside kinase [Neisseria sp.]